MLESIIVGVAVLLDRLSKLWAIHSLQGMSGGRMNVLPGILEFHYVENRGAAFSLFWGKTWFFILVSVVVIALLTGYLIKYRSQESIWLRIAIASILGGAIGNLIDRIFYGYVVDMINPLFVKFAVFNVADIFVTCGTILFVFMLIFWPMIKNRREKKRA